MQQRTLVSMIRRGSVISAAPELSVLEACQLMARHNIGALVVLRDNQLVGIFSERDAVKRVLADDLDPADTQLAAVMTENLITVEPETPTLEALRLMSDIGVRHLPVVEGDQVVAMISLRDFMGAELHTAAQGS